jgi:hypothetical protein
MGGLVGGVIGESPSGLSLLPLSSVMPGPLPEPEAVAESELSDVRDVASKLACAWPPVVAAGEDVVGDSLTLNRALFDVVSVEGGADFLLRNEGGWYECA